MSNLIKIKTIACKITPEQKEKLWNKYEYHFVGVANFPIPVKMNMMPSYPNVIFKEGTLGQTKATPEEYPDDYKWVSYEDFNMMLAFKMGKKMGVKFS